MTNRKKLAVVGVGRIGPHHARHLQELSRERENCELTALVEPNRASVEAIHADLQSRQQGRLELYSSVEEMLAAQTIDGAIVASSTDSHLAASRPLVESGIRILVEKPLAESLASTRDFAGYLEADPVRQDQVMVGYMRRFFEPLVLAKHLMDSGSLGRVFKVVSILEDPRPPHAGYESGGLLVDMAVHNVDEIQWLLGDTPIEVRAIGSNIYSHRTSPVKEDYDDGFVQLRFSESRIGQVTVSRNHVAAYRTETWIYGEDGMIHLGNVRMDPYAIDFDAFDREGRTLDQRSFSLRRSDPDVPPFIARFTSAYYAEAKSFLDCLESGAPFPVTHRDALDVARTVDGAQRSLAQDGSVVNLAG